MSGQIPPNNTHNDQALLDSVQHWRDLGYSVQTSMMLALAKHAANPGRPEQGSLWTNRVAIGLGAYRSLYTTVNYNDLV